MSKTTVAIVSCVVLAIVAGLYFYLQSSQQSSPNISTNSGLTTYTFPPTSPLPGLSFSYPSELGRVGVKRPSKAISRLEFEGGVKDGLYIISVVESMERQTFQQWVAKSYGYVPGQIHNPQINNDTSVATFTHIAGKEALKVTGYMDNYDHSLYLLNLGNGSVLVFAIRGASLPDATRDEIMGSIRIN